MSQPYVYMYPLPLEPLLPFAYSTSLGHHRALSWVPWVILQLPTSYRIYLYMMVCICQHYSLRSSDKFGQDTNTSSKALVHVYDWYYIKYHQEIPKHIWGRCAQNYVLRVTSSSSSVNKGTMLQGHREQREAISPSDTSSVTDFHLQPAAAEGRDKL